MGAFQGFPWPQPPDQPPTLQESPSSRQPVSPSVWVDVTHAHPVLRPLALGCVWGHTGRGSERPRQRRPPPLLPQLGAGGQELRGAGPGSALCQWEPQPQGAGGHRWGHPWGRAQGAGCDLTRPLLVGGWCRPDSPSCRLAHSSAAPTEAFLLVFVRAGPRQRRARRAGELGEAGAGMYAGPAARPAAASRRCLPPGLWEPGGHTCWRPGAEIGRQ